MTDAHMEDEYEDEYEDDDDEISVDELYQSKSELELVLARPTVYVGSQNPITQKLFMVTEDGPGGSVRLKPRSVTYVPALYKIFDEVLVNAIDNKQADAKMTMIKVYVDEVRGIVRVYNNGRTIRVEKFKNSNVYAPTRTFSHFRTSRHYDESKKRLAGGCNGYGSKLTNANSVRFTVKCNDAKAGKLFEQTWEKNMSITHEPKITKNTHARDWTEITFEPDYARFGITLPAGNPSGEPYVSSGRTTDKEMHPALRGFYDLIKRRTYDAAATTKGISVYFNDQLVDVKNFYDYVCRHLGTKNTRIKEKKGSPSQGNTPAQTPLKSDPVAAQGEGSPFIQPTPIRTPSIGESMETVPFVHKKINDRFEVAVARSTTGAEQIHCWTNGVWNPNGGTHEACVSDPLVDEIRAEAEKQLGSGGGTTKKTKGKGKATAKAKAKAKGKGKAKGTTAKVKAKVVSASTIKPAHIKNHLIIFINCLIENPEFDPQTKTTLTSPKSKWGTTCELDKSFLRRCVNELGIVQAVSALAKFKITESMTQGNSGRKRYINVDKLIDANWAGTAKSHECSLILTEGDSAASLAKAGLTVVGQDRFGVFPLRGKLVNVRDANEKKIAANEELVNLMTILGLTSATKDVSQLRYGHVVVMADQDLDGSHICGLIMNFFAVRHPELIRVPGFMQRFITPIVRASRTSGTPKGEKISFFTDAEFRAFEAQNPTGWKYKYYKGLATSGPADAKEYFSALDRHLKTVIYDQDADARFHMAFAKKETDARKEWLANVPDNLFLDSAAREFKASEFIDKELILFSAASNARSITPIADGLKPTQRKILYCCLKNNIKNEIKVCELAGKVMGIGYHHGDAALNGTIIGLTQNYVGSNNINLLMPIGMLGTREQGGKDAGSARYVFTELSPITRKIFHPDDEACLRQLQDDGHPIEYETYCPVIPMALVNSNPGTGTGWRSKAPSFNPRDLVKCLRDMLDGKSIDDVQLVPWYKNWKGTLVPTEGSNGKKFTMTGIIRKTSPTTLSIEELPVGTWTEDYNAILAKLKEDGLISQFSSHHGDIHIHYNVTLKAENMAIAESEGLEKKFKLVDSVSLTELVFYDTNKKLKRYDSPVQLLKEFYELRYAMYTKRKAHLVAKMNEELRVLNNKARFIKAVVDEELVIRKVPRKDLVARLKLDGYDSIPKKQKNKAATNEMDTEMEDGGDEQAHPDDGGYDYLLSMQIWSLSKERYESLQKLLQRKNLDLEELKQKTEKQMWFADLDAFMIALDQHEADERALLEGNINKAKSSSKSKDSKVTASKKRKRQENDTASKKEEKVML